MKARRMIVAMTMAAAMVTPAALALSSTGGGASACICPTNTVHTLEHHISQPSPEPAR